MKVSFGVNRNVETNSVFEAVSYQIVSGLLDTFPSATREIRVLDLYEITVYKITTTCYHLLDVFLFSSFLSK
ncbi:hypothetical protein OUZ56_012395 [Daphnia magna]|uniref:Uncharacterized protein n=1 Tax=Daphnia magna TaxID=35525 RepID=A0ABQ9Z349_9CRUS|nr:hypothetical protein OUZ56_012395 [Daphnia magna]